MPISAPTTPKGARSATTANGNPYPPFDLCQLVKGAGATYVARGSVLQPHQLMDEIGKALTTPAFSFVEVLSPCPTQYGRRNRLDSPAATMDEIRDHCSDWVEVGQAGSCAADMLLLGEYGDG